MDKSGKISLSQWALGMANSPYSGFASVVGCEIFDVPGIIKIANKTKLNITPTGLAIKKLTDQYGTKWMLTRDGKLYKNGTVIQTGITNPWDMCVFQDYLIIRHGSGSGVLSAYGALGSTNTYHANFYSGLDASYYGKMLVGTVEDVNGAVYIGNGRYVATLKQVAGKVFDPTDVSTFAVVDHAYTINNGFCVTFAEIGDLLAIGTQQGSNFFDRINYKSADIHYWDRSSVKADSIVHFNECGIQALIGKNNRIYAVAGTRGNIYESDTSTYVKFKIIPWNNNRIFNQSMQVWPNAIEFNQHGNLLVGTSTAVDAFGATPSNSKHGVYEISLDPVKNVGIAAVLKNVVSSGNVGANQPLAIGMIYSGASDSLTVGWQDGSAYGVDEIDSDLYSGYTAYIESPLHYLGPKGGKKTIQQIEFKLGKPLVTGQGMKLYGRKNLVSDYKLLGTFDFATLGSVISHRAPAIFTDLEIAEFKIALTQETGAPVGSNIELLDFSLW